MNNAGISLHEKAFSRVTIEGFDKQFNTNFRGPFFLTQRVITHMEKNGVKGHVIFISSETGDMADIRPYGLTKAAINSLVQGLAYNYIKKGIRVNAIACSVIATDMFNNMKPDIQKKILKRVAMKRPADLREISDTALFLSSDKASYITGQIIRVDGGYKI